MIWGHFQQPTAVHVAPCTQNGYVLPGHALNDRCDCHPTPHTSPDWKKTVWIHHDNH